MRHVAMSQTNTGNKTKGLDLAQAIGSSSRPWLKWYGAIPPSLTCPDITLYDAVLQSATRTPDAIAWDFFDTAATYRQFLHDIDVCADALSSLGLKVGDRIIIAMPTSPQGIIAFYAANKLGAVPAMVHPLCAPAELEHYLNATKARMVITLDICYAGFAATRPANPVHTLILTRPSDYLPLAKRIVLLLRGKSTLNTVPHDARVQWWRSLMAKHTGRSAVRAKSSSTDAAAIMFSAGTTGTAKGIVLSNRNFIAEGMAALSWVDTHDLQAILAAMPIFHGFGLSLCVNAAFMVGKETILLPVPDPKLVADLIQKKRPNMLLAVPTFYDSMIHNVRLAHTNLSCLSVLFSGGDTLPPGLKQEFDAFIAKHGSHSKLLQGYGLTETVSAIMGMPGEHREGSIGVPLPGTTARICRVGTDIEVPPGTEGEICISGPAVMLGYLDDPQATAQALHEDSDGTVWLHTGDLGTMDEDGFFYFKERLKRVIKSSGFNVFPSEVEKVLSMHPLVQQACVVGVKDERQGERVKAFIVLKDKSRATHETEQDLIDYCRSQLIKWSCPREIEFRSQLPLTRLGKIDYKALSPQHN